MQPDARGGHVSQEADRLPPLSAAEMTAEQQAAVAEISAGPRGGVSGPFVPLLRSPELMSRLQRTGEYLRFHSDVEQRLIEMCILLVARHWNQQYEWSFHRPLTLEEGLDSEVVEAIAQARRPSDLDEITAAVYDVVDELQRTRDVTTPTFDRAVRALGEPGLIDVVGTVGYYTTLAMVMNTSRAPTPDSAGPRLPDRGGG